MTRQEFIDEITTWDELLDFCYEEDCTVCVDIISNTALHDRINEDLWDAVGERGWEDVRDLLDDIDLRFDYYRIDGRLSYMPADDDFDGYKDEVMEWMDNGEYWDADEDAEDQNDGTVDEEDTVEGEPQAEEEDFSIGELIGACNAELTKIQQIADERREQDVAAFEQFLNGAVTVLQ